MMAPEPKPIQQPYGETVTDYTELLARLDDWSDLPLHKASAAAIRDLTAQLEAERKAREKAEQPEMRHMVTRFLQWPLPPSVCADLCATDYGKEGRVGTNLLTADEAENMLRYVLRGRAFAYGMLKMEAEGLRKHAEVAEAKLAAVEAETIERCAKIVAGAAPGFCGGKAETVLYTIAASIRALRTAAPK